MAADVQKRKQYPARKFYRATVACPSCRQRFKQADEKCPRCGFDAYSAVQSFPFAAPVLGPVVDNVGVIGEALQKELAEAASRMAKKFPQIGFHFCTVEFDDPVNLTEFGFWMMNACKLAQNQQETDRAWSILLLIDVRRGLAALTPGYAVEAFVEDSGWENALRLISGDLAAGNFRAALMAYFRHAETLLCEAARSVSRKVKKS